MSELGEEDGEVLPVNCGLVTGKLHMKKFLCPGIHQECIQCEDGSFVTPKVFAVMGEKEKLKDWKNAIRWNGKSIRKRIDAGDIDFYNHDEICTGRCASRNLGGSKYDVKIESLKSEDQVPSTTTGHKRQRRKTSSHDEEFGNFRTMINNSSLSDGSFSVLREVQKDNHGSLPDYTNQPVFPSAILVPANKDIMVEPTSQCQDLYHSPSAGIHSNMASPNAWNGNTPQAKVKPEPCFDVYARNAHSPSDVYDQVLNLSLNTNHGSAKENSDFIAPTPQSSIDDQETLKYVNELPDSNSLLEESACCSTESEVFWRNIHQVGLMDDVFLDIRRELDSLRQQFISVQNGNSSVSCSKRLSNVVSELGLMDRLKHKLAAAKTSTLREHESLVQEIHTLKQRVRETEHKQKALKRKSECFDMLMEIGRCKRPSTDTSHSSSTSNCSSPDNTHS